MKYLKPLLYLPLLIEIVLAGCVLSPQSPEMIGRNLPRAIDVHDAVIVTVEGGGKSPLLEGLPLISNEEFAAALAESLRKVGLFRAVETSGSAPFILQTTLEDLDKAECLRKQYI